MTIKVISHSVDQPPAEKPVEQKEEIKSAPEAKATEQKEVLDSETKKTDEKEREEPKDNLESDDDSEEPEGSDSNKPKKKGGFKRKIDKLNSKISEERRLREAVELRLAQLENAGNSKPDKVETSKAIPVEGKPNPDSFDTHAEYVEALTDWKFEQREKDSKDKANKAQLMTDQEKLIKSHQERVKSFSEKVDDFKEVLESVDDVPVSMAIQELILSSESGPELMYELAKNKAEYERICKLPPLAAAREIGKIESKIAPKSSEEKNKPEPKKITKAPQPIEPVGSKGGSVSKRIDDPNLSQAEYEKLRREQMRSA